MTDNNVLRHFDVHVCLVSQQTVPNLFPIMAPEFQPERVLLCVTDDMKEEAADLRKAISRYPSVKAEEIRISDPFNIESTFNEISQWLDTRGKELSSEGLSIALNATGGTKPMVLGSVYAFDIAGLPVFYYGRGSVELLRLGKMEKFTLKISKWSLDAYLLAYGYKPASSISPVLPISDDLKAFADEVIRSKAETEAISQLNFYASEAAKQNSLEYRGFQSDEALDAMLDNAGRWVKVKGGSLVFNSEADRKFLNGGWLEDYAADACRQIGVKSLAKNLEIISSANGTKNELDVTFILNGILHIIEVKTRRYKKTDNSSQDVLHKLNSLGQELGYTKRCLLSLIELPDNLKQRAKDLGIQIISGSQLYELPGAITRWANQQ